MFSKSRRLWSSQPSLVFVVTVVACSGPVSGADLQRTIDGQDCSINASEIFSGGPGKDGIPALSNPAFVPPGAPGAEYLLPDDRVIGLRVGGEVMAVPINILWWHEIVNLDVGGSHLAVTHCPITGSSLVFDRSSVSGAEFGVSGLLYRNNLIMYDRRPDESLWPQMARQATCGNREGESLEMVAAAEMTWNGWATLYPHTVVVSSETDFARDYRSYPYGDYDRIDNSRLLFPLESVDQRRPPKERVLGIPDGEGARAYPFGALEELGTTAAVQDGSEVVFWDGSRQAAVAYSRMLDGEELDFQVEDGQIRDSQTGSSWRIDGAATAGPLTGRRLAPVKDAFVAYWFAWPAFYPNTVLWETP